MSNQCQIHDANMPCRLCLTDRIAELEAQLAAVNIAIENRWQFGQDGDSWYATQYDFINLQESESGWGDTPVDAIAELKAVIGEES